MPQLQSRGLRLVARSTAGAGSAVLDLAVHFHARGLCSVLGWAAGAEWPVVELVREFCRGYESPLVRAAVDSWQAHQTCV